MGSYNIPPLVASATVPLIVGAASVIVLPAPGGGAAYRIASFSVGISRNATGDVDCTLSDGITQLGRAPGAMRLAGTPGYYVILPEPGLQAAEDAAIEFTFGSTAATGSGLCVLYYYIDFLT